MANPLGSTPGIIVGVGVGTAVSTALEPAIERPRQQAWHNNPVKQLDPATIARLVAQGGIPLDQTAYDAAKDEGLDTDKLNALVYLAQTVPGFAEALTLWRRNPNSFAELWHHALTKSGIDARYIPYLDQLETDRLSPPVIALAIVRGIMSDPGFLPVGPPTTEGKVKAFPTSALDPLTEAQAHGFDRQRLFVQTAITGRPMGPEAAASAVFRGILERVDYDRAISEGDIRNEWADAIFEASRAIISPADAAGLRLRGWITAAESYALGAQHGATQQTMDYLYLNRGRPAAPAQMATAAVRGIVGPDGVPMDRAQFLKGIAESDIRPEWGPMLWDSRFLYPSLFQLNRLVTSGAIDVATGVEWATKARYAPEVVTALEASWSGSGAATAAPWQAKAATRLYTTTHTEYLDSSIDEAFARVNFDTIGIPVAEQDQVLALWDAERTTRRRELTPAQIKKAYKAATFTLAEATTYLQNLGMSAADVTTFLNE